MSEQKEIIRISVRNLVEFILRSGDIDDRGLGNSKDAMQEGSKMHRRIQRAQGNDYLAEVPLRYQVLEEGYTILLEGRADGIISNDSGVTIDEIKGIYMDPVAMEEPFSLHLAQAKCYGVIYLLQHELTGIKIQMTYCNLDTEVIRRFTSQYEKEELLLWFENLIGEYKKWAELQIHWREIRQKSIHQLVFPFPYRKGQGSLVKDVYRSIIRKKNLFIQAPTGVGKTISTVFPAVKAVGEGYGDKLFYLTAKTITRTVAQETFSYLKKQGYRGKVMALTAKEKICPLKEMSCNPLDCPYAKGHYDRVNDGVFQLVSQEEEFTRESLLKQAEQFQVCPFELELDAALWCDVIICDYNYVFDPNVYLKRFFQDGIKGDYIFLVDEAHNLVERGREMYSAELFKESFLEMKKLVEPYSHKLAKQFDKCNHQLLEYKRECESYQEYNNIGHFALDLMKLGGMMDEVSTEHREVKSGKEWGEFYFQLRHFMNMYDILDENYSIYTELQEDGRFKMKLLCVNTAKVIQEKIEKANSTIFFSATLLPIQYYKTMLSTETDNYAVYAETAFAKEQNLLLIGNDVSSKYTRRNEEEYQKMADYILAVAQAKIGNYLVFFPSYQMMEQVYEVFSRTKDSLDCMVQKKGLTEEGREEFLTAFSGENHRGLLGFCVMGGVFGEGIDLKGKRLIGTMIMGTGLPKVSNERNILKNYFDKIGKNGFDYAYRYPGMNKVMQAAGRVIRTVDDVGVIVLMDERFLHSQYRELFPREWENYDVCNIHTIKDKLEEFWKRNL
ncbi:MAG: ATP-dependent DNA helicase [Lachnospiraceae bacterium]